VILRQFSSIFSSTFASFGLALACALVVGPWASSALAQDDDLYGVPGTPAAAPAPAETIPPAPSPSPKKIAAPDTGAVVPRVDTASAPAVVPSPDAKPARPRVITRETTVNPLDTRRGNYRNPKKALFMSLMVPGLGQAYVGQSAFNYTRAALYFGTEIALGASWYHYTVVKYDRQVKRYRRHADTHWSQGAYEDAAFDASAAETFADNNPYRTVYCEAVVARGSGAGEALYRGCANLLVPDSASLSASYQNFRNDYDDSRWFGATPSPDSAGLRRAGFADPVEFYSLIGRYQEFVGGWDDVAGLAYGDSSIAGTSANRAAYAAMRGKAQDYSRMQAWFIGGIALNHIASAIDAALTARRNNKHLYEGESQARWYDRIGVDGGLAFQGGQPLTRMTARLSF
jgi:hypothetical protein